MKRELGIARCGLACCLCSENDKCSGCNSNDCPDKDWCENRKCSLKKNLEHCYNCDENCRKGLLSKIKPYAFTLFAKRYGEKYLLDCLEANEKNGIVYHRNGIVGDYDAFNDAEELIEFIKQEGSSLKEQFVYHVVTEKPMQIGQHIIFDENNHNGVFKRVNEKLDIVNAIYANPEIYKDVTLEHHTSVALREMALEKVRVEKYPYYPSRMACLYVSKTLKEAENWFDYFISLGRPTFQIVKLKINGNVFCGDAEKCFDGKPNETENLTLAEKYWKNENEPSIMEMLVDGDIEVVEIIKGI